MKQFLVHTLPGSVLSVDISDVGKTARSLESQRFNSWKSAENHFRGLGAPQETLDSVADAIKKSGAAKLVF